MCHNEKTFEVLKFLLFFRLIVGCINSGRMVKILTLFITLHTLQNLL